MGKMTGMMNAEDKVLLLGECVPMHEGTAEERQVRARLFVCVDVRTRGGCQEPIYDTRATPP